MELSSCRRDYLFYRFGAAFGSSDHFCDRGLGIATLSDEDRHFALPWASIPAARDCATWQGDFGCERPPRVSSKAALSIQRLAIPLRSDELASEVGNSEPLNT